MRRTLLYLTYKFPPILSVESLRAKRFARYLPDHGWRPVVLTLAARPDQRVDRGLLAPAMEDAPVLRVTPAFQSLLRARQTLREGSRSDRRLASLLGAPYRFFSVGPPVTASVLLRAQWAVKRFAPDLVLASFGPPSALWAAHLLNSLHGVPYVAEFRDLWVGNEYSNKLKGTYTGRGKYLGVLSALKQKRQLARQQAGQERTLVDGSCGLVVVGEQMVETYCARYPAKAERVLELSHGFDEEDFPGTPRELARAVASRGSAEPVLICHLGTLHQFRRTDTLFAAIRAAAQRNPKLTERVRLVFVGNVDPANRRAIETCPVLSTMVSLLNRVPHKEALRLALDSDALLLLTGPLVWEQTGKLSEYVAMGRPILCLSHPDSSASRLVRRTGTGTVFPHGETEALTEFLVNVSTDRSALGALWNPDFDEIDKLSARALTGKLAGFLEECVETAARETRRPGEP